jgi:GNAT superfamily N-acetyltransferase
MLDITLLKADEAVAALPDLCAILRDAVERGASVGFVLPLEDAVVLDFWQGVIDDVRAGKRLLLVARLGGEIVGTVQLDPASKPNATHRAEVQKLLVHSRARRRGVGEALMRTVEAEARRRNRSLLVLDTVVGCDAERLYQRLGYQSAGVIPHFAITPDRTGIDPTHVMYRLLDT